jgi:hypothetical protein
LVRYYAQFFNLAAETIRHLSRERFFRDGSSRRAALAAFKAQEAGYGIEVILDVMSDSLDNDSTIFLFDDPCDAWAA